MKATSPHRHPARAGVPGRLRLPVNRAIERALRQLRLALEALERDGGAVEWL